MGQNRIDSQCWYNAKDDSNPEWRKGILRAWSVDYDELDNGAAQFPVGVIEDWETMEVKSVYVGVIKFGRTKPQ